MIRANLDLSITVFNILLLIDLHVVLNLLNMMVGSQSLNQKILVILMMVELDLIVNLKEIEILLQEALQFKKENHQSLFNRIMKRFFSP